MTVVGCYAFFVEIRSFILYNDERERLFLLVNKGESYVIVNPSVL